MHLKCRLQMADSPSRPQWVIVMSSDIRVYVRNYWNLHIHRNVILWDCIILNLDAILGRWGRRGGCRVDDGVPVVVNSTAVGAATSCHGGLSVQLIIYHVITTCFALYIYFDMPLRYQLRVLYILLNGWYLYLWLYVLLLHLL